MQIWENCGKDRPGAGRQINPEKNRRNPEKNRRIPFRRYLFSRMLNRFGDSIDVFLLSWLVYQLGESAALSSLALGLNYVPTILLQPFAGPWVDRVSKRRLLALTDMGRALLVLCILILYLLGRLKVPFLLAGTFLISVLEAFGSPASSSMLPRLLKKEEYDDGASEYQARCRLTELAATGIAGGMIAAMGSAGALFVDMACFIAAAILVATIPVQEEGGRDCSFSYLRKLQEGLLFLKRSRPMCLILGAAAFLNAALTPYQAFQAVLVQELYQKGSVTLSLMGSCISLGMLFGAVGYPMLNKEGGREEIFSRNWRPRGGEKARAEKKEAKFGKVAVDRSLLTCGILMGSFYLVLTGLQRLREEEAAFFIILAAACLIFGISVGIANTAISALMMETVPAEYMARESALMNAGCTAAVPFTSFLISPFASAYGVERVLNGIGILTVLITAFLMKKGTLHQLEGTERMEEGRGSIWEA